jgi:hypothetical protein
VWPRSRSRPPIRASSREPPSPVFAPEQHDLYDGHFVLSANRLYMVGGLNDAPGWDHMDNAAAHLWPASGTVDIDVDEIKNTGTFKATLKIPDGNLELAIDRWNEFNPVSERRHRRVAARARHRLGLRRQQLAQGVRVPGGLGLRPRHAERQAALPGLRDALHGHAGDAGPEDAEGELPDGGTRSCRPAR